MTERKHVTVYTRGYLAKRLIEARDGWSDEIPNRIIHSNEPNNKYKVRTSWIAAVANDLDRSITVGILPNSVKEDVNKFFNWYKTDFRNKPGDIPINTRDDVEKVNLIINKVLDSLEIGPNTQNAGKNV